jgi:putative chitinase
MIDQKTFFDSVRGTLFEGHMSPGQVAGMVAIINEWDATYGDAADPRWLAYAFATTFHETAQTMEPIREFGLGRNYPYGKPDPITHQTYYGRGFVQLTWKANYARQANKLRVDLVGTPDLAMDAPTAAKVLLGGMVAGDFTGATLGHYFNDTADDPVNARRIINGTDCAEKIAGYFGPFLDALSPLPVLSPAPVPVA